ncbi:hypothetical protein ACO0LF_01920 [Undibacterium sp. Di27W]
MDGFQSANFIHLRAACTYERSLDDAQRSQQLVFALIKQFVFCNPSALEGVKKSPLRAIFSLRAARAYERTLDDARRS